MKLPMRQAKFFIKNTNINNHKPNSKTIYEPKYHF